MAARPRAALLAGLVAFAVLWIGSSIEAFTYFDTQAQAIANSARPETGETVRHLRWAGQLSLSLLWSAYAGLLTAAGLRVRLRALRSTGLVVFGITLIKVLWVDVPELRQSTASSPCWRWDSSCWRRHGSISEVFAGSKRDEENRPDWMSGLALFSSARAQTPGAAEPLSAWPYFKELRSPGAVSGLLDFLLDREVLDQARADQADLRLYDGEGHEIPYVLRVRHQVETQAAFPVREFNRGVEGGAAVVSADLGAQPVEHNLVEIDTAGVNYRRLADVQGSAHGVAWSTLASQAILFRFSAVGRSVEQLAVPYPVSRYRYLRVRVSRDPQVDSDAPQIVALRVRRSIRVQGEMTPFPADASTRRRPHVWPPSFHLAHRLGRPRSVRAPEFESPPRPSRGPSSLKLSTTRPRPCLSHLAN